MNNTLKENNSQGSNKGNHLKAMIISTMTLYSIFTNAQTKDKYFIDSLDYKNKITNLLEGTNKDSLLKECDTIIAKGNELIALKLYNQDTAKQKENLNFFNKKLKDNYRYSMKLAGSALSLKEGSLNGYEMNSFIQSVAQKAYNTLSQDKEIRLEKDKDKLNTLLSKYLKEREDQFIEYILPKLQIGKEKSNDICWNLSAIYEFQSGGNLELLKETEIIRKQKIYKLQRGTNIKIFIKDLREIINHKSKDLNGKSYIEKVISNFEETIREHKETNIEEYFEKYKEGFRKNGYFETNQK